MDRFEPIDEFEELEAELCYDLDRVIYLPVKAEVKEILERKRSTYSLGARKEDFKGIIHGRINDLKQRLKGAPTSKEIIGKLGDEGRVSVVLDEASEIDEDSWGNYVNR